jgi:hypothetical protein
MGYGRKLRRDQGGTNQPNEGRDTPDSGAAIPGVAMTDDENMRQQHRKTAIIAGAMMIALAFYAILVLAIDFRLIPIVRPTLQGFGGSREGVLILGLIVFIGIRSSRKTILKRNPADDAKTLVNKFRTVTIITFGLCEIPALAGMILFFLGSPVKDFYVLTLYSLTLMVLYFPKYRHWQIWVQKPTAMY